MAIYCGFTGFLKKFLLYISGTQNFWYTNRRSLYGQKIKIII